LKSFLLSLNSASLDSFETMVVPRTICYLGRQNKHALNMQTEYGIPCLHFFV
jgi:hypothetical protein